MTFNNNSLTVLNSRYLQKNDKGEVIESPEDLFLRVAKTVAGIEKDKEKWIKIFYDIMINKEFIPNSPTLLNAGKNKKGSYSACFVLPVEDSIEDIFGTIRDTAIIQSAGGGTGFSFSRLRPKGDIVNSSKGTTSGVLSFISVFSSAGNAIEQGGMRRSANMAILDIWHPEVIDFIKAKDDLSKFTNFNFSVAVNDKFMQLLNESPNTIWKFKNPRTGRYTEKDCNNNKYTVKKIWDMIVERAWKTGEPGVIFIDEINKHNTLPKIGYIESTNPCGEQPLLPYESCNLGSINLLSCVKEGKKGIYFSFTELKKIVKITTRFLDNIIDVNNYPIKKIEEICKANRKIGLGVMGFGDVLYRLDIPYNSKNAVSLGRKIMKTVQEISHKTSNELAEEKGKFPNWDLSIWNKQNIPMRNACTTTVAPTGSISIIAGCSGGIEPLFSLAFVRNVLNGKKLIEVNPIFKEIAEKNNFWGYPQLLEELASGSRLKDYKNIPSNIKEVFVTSHDISPEWHIKMQSAFQENCDSSISKTINFAHDANKEDVDYIFREAYKLKCKGVTIYRDGCRANQPMALKNKKVIQDILPAVKIKQKTPFGNMHVKISIDPNTSKELEIFAQLGKGGSLEHADLEAIGRLASLCLRYDANIESITDQLEDIGSSVTIPSKNGRIKSLPDGLAMALKKYLNAKKENGVKDLFRGFTINDKIKKKTSKDYLSVKCPDCGYNMSNEEGCIKCYNCGFSQC